jgi:hypothetical protein
MKTAISIDEALLKEADKTAAQMGLSRSRLFTISVGEFLRRDEQMLHRLNEVYAKSPDLAEKRLVKGMKAKIRSDGEGKLVTEIRQGQVYWLDFGLAFSSAPAERHPCVVFRTMFNRSAIATSVVCRITSNPGIDIVDNSSSIHRLD